MNRREQLGVENHTVMAKDIEAKEVCFTLASQFSGDYGAVPYGENIIQTKSLKMCVKKGIIHYEVGARYYKEKDNKISIDKFDNLENAITRYNEIEILNEYKKMERK